MSKALSLDLRVRVLSAVESGATHRQVAERFGVSAASVSRWRSRARQKRAPRPKALGGDRRSGRIETHRDTVLGVVAATRDITIEQAQAAANGRRTLRRRPLGHQPDRQHASPHADTI